MVLEKRIGISSDYFRRVAKADYQDWKSALAREFLQNSRDAGSTCISFEFDEEEMSLTVTDDGCGMNADVIENKLLVLGGSFKVAGSVGGFGKAKELLFFAWEKYEIRTQNIRVNGVADSYNIQTSEEYQMGVIAKIWFSSDIVIASMRTAFQDYLKFSNGIKVMLDGKEVKQVEIGKLVKSIDFADIYQDTENTQCYASVRIKGVQMHGRYVGEKHGTITIELKGESVDILTANRDGCKYTYSQQLEVLMKLMSTDPTSWKRNRNVISEFFPGKGLVSNRKKVSYDPDSPKIFKTIRSDESRSKQIAAKMASNPGESSLVESMEKPKPRIRFLPDFYVRSQGEEDCDGNSLVLMKPPYWNRKPKMIAKLWELTLSQVVIDNDISIDFGIGFTFLDADAESYYEDGLQVFLINPASILKQFSKISDIADEVFDLAIHEIAHTYENYHDEDFCKWEHNLRRGCRKSKKVYRNLHNVVTDLFKKGGEIE